MDAFFRHLIITCLIFISALSACTANRESLRKQSESNRMLGEEYIRQGNYTSALKYLLEAERQYANDPILHNVLGLAYMEKGHLDVAVVHFKRAIKLKPRFPEARNSLGVAYMRKGDSDAAITIFKELTLDILYPTPQIPLFNLGWMFYQKKNYAQSEIYYLETLKVSPKFIKALRGLGLTYMAMGKGRKAVTALEKAVELSPGTPLLYYDLAGAYTVSGDILKAQEAYRNVIELNPNGELADDARKAAGRLR